MPRGNLLDDSSCQGFLRNSPSGPLADRTLRWCFAGHRGQLAALLGCDLGWVGVLSEDSLQGAHSHADRKARPLAVRSNACATCVRYRRTHPTHVQSGSSSFPLMPPRSCVYAGLLVGGPVPTHEPFQLDFLRLAQRQWFWLGTSHGSGFLLSDLRSQYTTD